MNQQEKIFFIVGAQRCGTTYLAHELNKHPQIRMAQPIFPEPKFFLKAEEFSKGKEYYLNKFFKDRTTKEFLGEKSTSYIESKETAQRIKEMFPSAKIIISLRNPVDRALSNYFFSRENKIETRSLQEVFLENKYIAFGEKKYSVSPYDYLGRGEYLKYLKNYFEVFGRENIKVMIFEKFTNGIEWNELFDFLNLEKIHAGVEKMNASLGKEVVDKSIILNLKNYFRDQNAELQKFLNIDLSLWD